MKTSVITFLFLCIATMVMGQYDPEKKLAELGIDLPEVSQPIANYVKYVRSGNLVFLAGHGPMNPLDETNTGKVGSDLTIEQGYAAARSTGIGMLATLKAAVGNLDQVVRVVKVTGMVNSAPDFYDQPRVVNGFSDLMTEVFGDKGKHARAAVGMVSLPSNICVEIEMIVEVK